MADVLAIDPSGCNCTECLTGEYVPLDRATNAQIAKMLAGGIRDNTGGNWHAYSQITFTDGYIVRTWTTDSVHGK